MKSETIGLDEKIATKHNNGGVYDYSVPVVLTIEITQFQRLYYINNPGNCKIGTVMKLQDCMLSNEGTTIKRLKELFTDGSRKFGFKATFNCYEAVKQVAKHFSPMYITRVPMVDFRGYQYHVMFWTGRTDGPSFLAYKNRIEREKVQVLLNAASTIENAPLGEVLDANAPTRKELTEAQIKKIRAYKSKHFLTKYVEKLVNGETV